MTTNRRQFLKGLPLLSASFPENIGFQDDLQVDWLRLAKLTDRPLFLDASKYSPVGAHTRRAMTYLQIQHQLGRTAHVVIGFHGEALARLLSAATWRKLDLPAKFGLPDSQAELNQEQLKLLLEPIRSNLFSHRITLLGCRQTFIRWTQDRPQKNGTGLADTEVDLLPPGMWTEAMVVASAEAQQAGLSYVVSTP